MDEIEIDFDEIKEGDTIRTVRSDENVTISIEGIAEWQDDDDDWNCGDTLLTYKDGNYEETYYLASSGSLPTDPGTLVTWDNYRGLPIFALKTYGDEGWFTSFPDGSSGFIKDLHIARKNWTQVS